MLAYLLFWRELQRFTLVCGYSRLPSSPGDFELLPLRVATDIMLELDGRHMVRDLDLLFTVYRKCGINRNNITVFSIW